MPNPNPGVCVAVRRDDLFGSSISANAVIGASNAEILSVYFPDFSPVVSTAASQNALSTFLPYVCTGVVRV